MNTQPAFFDMKGSQKDNDQLQTTLFFLSSAEKRCAVLPQCALTASLKYAVSIYIVYLF